MRDKIKEECPFKGNIDECQYCRRLGICYTDDEFDELYDKKLKAVSTINMDDFERKLKEYEERFRK